MRTRGSCKKPPSAAATAIAPINVDKPFKKSNFAGPKADLTGRQEGPQLEKIAECLRNKGPDPAMCSPARELTWNDFNGAPPKGGPFEAETATSLRKVDVPSQQCTDAVLGHAAAPARMYQAVFDPAASWVRPGSRSAANPVTNGSAKMLGECQKFFADEAKNHRVGGRFAGGAVGPAQPCDAAVTSSNTEARSQADCAIIANAMKAAAIAESERVLRHEQYHFKLTCALAKKGNSQIARGTSFAALDAVLGNKLHTAQGKYDDPDSKHGCNPGGQAQWEHDIDAGLLSITLP